MATFFVRHSEHIQEDIARNWSSWNFGQGGFKGTWEELEASADIEEETDCRCPFGVECDCKTTIKRTITISDFEFVDIDTSDIRELYPNYWVLVDQNFTNGLAFVSKEFASLEEAEAACEAEFHSGEFGEGTCYNARNLTLVKSVKYDFHIFQINE